MKNNYLVDLFNNHNKNKKEDENKTNNKEQNSEDNNQNEYLLKPNIYFKIDQKNSFSKLEEKEIPNIDIFTTKFKDNENLIYENINTIINKLLEKISNSNITNDPFIVSQNISKLICKNNKIGKDNIDSVINHLIRRGKNNIYKSQNIILTKNKCEIIGSILCYSYLRLQPYKIKDMNRLMEIQKIILDKGIDVEKDFIKYCKEKKLTDQKITYYWKSQRNKYICLPELIFLINRYSQINEISIDINLFNEYLNEDISQTQLIILTILNIHWLFNSIKSFKINLINENFEKLLYNNYLIKLNDFCSNIIPDIKKNILINVDNIFKKKWNFTDIFKLKENTNILNQENITNNILNQNNALSRQSVGLDAILNKARTYSLTGTNRTMMPHFSNNFPLDYENEINLKKLYDKNNKNKEEDKDSIENTVKTFNNTLQIILITLFSLNNSQYCQDLELIMNDSYSAEFLIFFKNILGFETLDENLQEFNILDLLLYNNQLKRINKINIEINTLDFTSFENLLNVLYNNQSLASIKMSFFSSDITYYPQVLYKIFGEQHEDENLLKYNYEQSTYLFGEITTTDEKILNKLSSYFNYNLYLLFVLILNLPNLIELYLNFEIPDNIVNNTNYMNSILKFILNILFFSLNNSKIKKFCLLSPKIVFDKRKIPNINNLISNINIDKNLLLKDLSLQFQFYKISDINNFINTRLFKLNIGDLDIETFKVLCDNICSNEFNINSSLQKLSIGLLNTIIDFTIEIKLLFRKLFSIKIRQLTTLNIYSNIIINDEIEYAYLLQILNNNWISEYNIILNSNSEKIIYTYPDDIKKLKFYVPHNLEKQLLEPDDIMNLKGNPITFEVDNNKDYYDDAYWYLKYLFENVYVDKMKSANKNKKMIMGILKYLYFLKTPKIHLHSFQVGY